MRRICGIMLLLVLVLSGCGSLGGNALYTSQDDQTWANIVSQHMDADTVLTKRSAQEYPFAAYEQGFAIEASDVQVRSAEIAGLTGYWYPQTVETLVIALDRDRTDAVISGWQDVSASQVRLRLQNDGAFYPYLLSAVAYGLDPDSVNPEPAVELLSTLYRQGRLILDGDADGYICLDSEAVRLYRQGRNLEIIVPKDGTYSYQVGVLSKKPIIFSDGLDRSLLDAGFRLVDGRASDPVYPAAEQYESAVTVEDLQGFLKTAEDSTRLMRRDVFQSRRFASADYKEHSLVALLLMMLCVFWVFSIYQRTVRKDIRRIVLLQGFLLIGWTTLRLIRYQLDYHVLLGHLCWYGFYIAMLGLPLCLLWLSLVIDRSSLHPPRGLGILAVICGCLELLVLTNDLHEQVFRFRSVWPVDVYTYQWGYYVTAAVCVGMLVCAIGIMLIKSRKGPNPIGKLLPLGVCALILLYLVAFWRNIFNARESDITITFCLLAILLEESAIRTGLIVFNQDYQAIFQIPELQLQLLDRQGRSVLNSSGFSIPAETVRQLQSGVSPAVLDEDTLLYACQVHGGMAAWKTDTSALGRLNREIQVSVDRQRAANALLAEEERVQRQLILAGERNQMMTALENQVRQSISQLSTRIQALPQAEDRNREIATITLLLCYIKRRCNLFFLSQETRLALGDELLMYLVELAELSAYVGVQALVLGSIHGELNIDRATICYDFFFQALSWAMDTHCSTLLGQLSGDSKSLSFKLMPAKDPTGLAWTETLTSRVAAAGGALETRDLDDAWGLWLQFPKEAAS